MKKQMKNTPRGRGLGFLADDIRQLNKFMEYLGWTDAQLAAKAGLSQQMINAARNGKKNLSAPATDRVIEVVDAACKEKKAAEGKGRLTPSAAARIREKAKSTLTGGLPEDAELKDPGSPPSIDNLVVFSEFMEALSAPPRDRAAYEAWKAKRIAQYEAAKKLAFVTEEVRIWRESSFSMAKEADRLKATVAAQEETISMYKAWVERLKQQIRNAGLTPTT